MIYPVIIWLLWKLDAPTWAWALTILKIATEFYATPLYIRIIKRDRDERQKHGVSHAKQMD